MRIKIAVADLLIKMIKNIRIVADGIKHTDVHPKADCFC